MKLPPLKEVDDSIETIETTELNFPKCKHDLYLVSSTEARCRKCPVGYSGTNIMKLIKSFKNG